MGSQKVRTQIKTLRSMLAEAMIPYKTQPKRRPFAWIVSFYPDLVKGVSEQIGAVSIPKPHITSRALELSSATPVCSN